MGELRDKMEANLKIGGYSEETQRIYLHYAKKYAAYFQRSPAEMGEDEVRAFLLLSLPKMRSRLKTTGFAVHNQFGQPYLPVISLVWQAKRVEKQSLYAYEQGVDALVRMDLSIRARSSFRLLRDSSDDATRRATVLI